MGSLRDGEMKTIQTDMLTRFNNMLKMRQVPLASHSDYRKWLKYYLDFRVKYPPLDATGMFPA